MAIFQTDRYLQRSSWLGAISQEDGYVAQDGYRVIGSRVCWHGFANNGVGSWRRWGRRRWGRPRARRRWGRRWWRWRFPRWRHGRWRFPWWRLWRWRLPWWRLRRIPWWPDGWRI